MIIFQLLIIVFGLYALISVFIKFRKKELSSNEFFIWSLVWLGIIIFVNMPFLLEGLTQLFGIQRTVDLAIYFSIIILFYALFKLHVKIEQLNKQITKIVRNDAIEKAKKKK